MSQLTQTIPAFAFLNDVSESVDLSLAAAPTIPYWVYENLPPFLQLLCGYFEEPSERDVFLTAALPVIAAHLPNIITHRRDGSISVDIYTAVVAPFGSGKGVASFARRLGQEADRVLYERTNNDVERWNVAQKAAKLVESESIKPPQERPTAYGLYCPANISATALHLSLQAAKGRTLIFESEIDTLTQTLKQDWGGYSDVLRKAFHHETVSHSRIQAMSQESSKALVRIEKPCLSVFLSGTDRQLVRLLGQGGVENGLYSRFALYYLRGVDKWLSSAPAANFNDRETDIGRASSILADIRQQLEVLNEPVEAVLDKQHYGMIDAAFSQCLQNWLIANAYIGRITQRSAVIAQRIAVMLSALRRPDEIASMKSYKIDTRDMETAITLALLYFDHSARFAIERLKSDIDEQVDPRALVFQLQQAGYSYREIAQETGIPKSTVHRIIQHEKSIAT